MGKNTVSFKGTKEERWVAIYAAAVIRKYFDYTQLTGGPPPIWYIRSYIAEATSIADDITNQEE